MRWPQITMIVLMSMSLAIGLCDHGKPRKESNFVNDLISQAILLTILLFGGFWK